MSLVYNWTLHEQAFSFDQLPQKSLAALVHLKVKLLLLQLL